MKIVFLGTNGWFSAEARNTICTLVDSGKYYVIFDAGDGIHKLDKYVKKNKPIHIFLSHLHLDHIYGLHIMPKFKRILKNEITLYCPKELKRDLDKIADHPFIMPLERFLPSFKTKVLTGRADNLPFALETKRLNHVDPTWGYRIVLDGKVVSYCCDTGKSENVLALAKGCDVLIHECSSPPGFVDKGWGHVNPKEAAEAAREAGAKKLYLTHFSPVKYPALKNRLTAQKAARKIFRNSFATRDGMIVKV